VDGQYVGRFFKPLKHTLKVKTFVGTSADAVRTQVWRLYRDRWAWLDDPFHAPPTPAGVHDNMQHLEIAWQEAGNARLFKVANLVELLIWTAVLYSYIIPRQCSAVHKGVAASLPLCVHVDQTAVYDLANFNAAPCIRE